METNMVLSKEQMYLHPVWQTAGIKSEPLHLLQASESETLEVIRLHLLQQSHEFQFSHIMSLPVSIWKPLSFELVQHIMVKVKFSTNVFTEIQYLNGTTYLYLFSFHYIFSLIQINFLQFRMSAVWYVHFTLLNGDVMKGLIVKTSNSELFTKLGLDRNVRLKTVN